MEFDVRSRLADAAEDVTVGPPRSITVIETHAKRLRRQHRTRVLGAIAAVAVVGSALTLPFVGDGSGQRHSPAGQSQQDCQSSAGTRTDSQLVLVRADCSLQPVNIEAGTVTYASLSPDEQSIAYVRYVGGNARLEVLDLPSGDVDTVVTSVDTIGDPLWDVDDGSFVFWLNDGGGRAYLYKAKVESPTPIRITNGALSEDAPSLSTDGRSVVFRRGYETWVADTESGNDRRVANAPEGLSQPFWGCGQSPSLLGLELKDAGQSPVNEFRVVELNPYTGEVVTSSPWRTGRPTDGVCDQLGIHVAAVSPDGDGTSLITFDSTLRQVSEGFVAGVRISNMRAPESEQR